jgi:K+ transporter
MITNLLGRHLIVAVKYVMIVIRADNQGEGGTMASLTLALSPKGVVSLFRFTGRK